MRLGSARLEPYEDGWRIVCSVDLQGVTADWWIAVETAAAASLDVSAAPFLSVATLLASRHGEDLYIEQPVSSRHVHNCRAAARIFAGWWGWHVPQFDAVEYREREPLQSGRTGLLFTRGVDSTSVLLQGLSGEGPQPDVLIFVDELERSFSRVTEARNLADIRTMAAMVELPVARVRTNLRQIAEQWIRWEDAHGAVLLGTALALGGHLSTIVIAPTNPIHVDAPFGSTPFLDPCWSTDRTAVVAADPLSTRSERMHRVAQRRDLLPLIKLCWQGDQRGNCGRCRKCLVAASALVAVNEAKAIPLMFDTSPTVDAIRRLPPTRSRTVLELIDTLDAAASANADPGFVISLRDAWREFVAKTQAAAAATNAPVKEDDADYMHQLCLSDPDHQRPITWCVVDDHLPQLSGLAWSLSSHWGPGLVSLSVGSPPMPPPDATSRMLRSATVRCWWSSGTALDEVRLRESLDHGCVPLQFMDPHEATALRATLPLDLAVIVRSVDEVPQGRPDETACESIWFAAIRAVVTQAVTA
jgi:hypothetical protein